MKYFLDKTVWITGASAGIGKELALQLSSYGCRLILTSRNVLKLENVRLACAHSDKISVLACDLGNRVALGKFLESHKDELKDVDILINNAGLSQRSFVDETDIAVYEKLMDVNFFSAVQVSAFILKQYKKKRSGHIVTISSVAGKFGVPERSGYSASKMALHGFYDALRAENHKDNIVVTMVCPGFINTDISKNAIVGDGGTYGKLDPGQENGMAVDKAVRAILKGIASRKAEFTVGGFRETTLAVFVSRHLPGLFRRILRNSNTK